MAEQIYTYPNESFSGCDMVATMLVPNLDGGNSVYAIGEMQTISYSIHMDRRPVRSIGNINAKDYVMGPRTIAGSLVFAVFNKHFAKKIMEDIKSKANPGYSFLIDELPPFDIVISAANEYGLRSKLVIYGVRLVNEGQVMSVNDVYTENTYQFVATDLEYLNDENGYSSKSIGNKGLYVIADNELQSFNNEYVFNYKTIEEKAAKKIELKFKVKDFATNIKPGLVDFWLIPAKREGIISITNKETSEAFNIDVSENVNGNNRITVQLKAGEYNAIWSDGKLKSNSVTFIISNNVIQINEDTPAPLIESIGDTFIKVHSNCKQHTKVIYEDEDKNIFSVKLRGRNALIEDLHANATYRIATSNDDMNSISDFVKVITLPFGYDTYKDFSDYVYYNKKSFKNSDIDIYQKIIADAKKISMSGTRYETITDTFIEANKLYNIELSELKMSDFESMTKYEEAVTKLEELIAASLELITSSMIISNDEIYGYNYETFIVNPPKLEYINGCTNTFVVDNKIELMDFYRQFTNTVQFAKTINKKNFEPKDDSFTCTFNGKPGVRHYTYAANNYGFRSPRVDFYVYPDEERSIAIEEMAESKQIIEHELKHIDSIIGSKISSEFDDESRRRVLSEIIKSSEIRSTKPPIVKENNKHGILLEIIEDKEELINIEAMVVISDINNALLNYPKYKISVKNEIFFTAKNHGIRPRTDYAIWIEDNEGYQISDCITIESSDDEEMDITREYEVSEYFINNITDALENEFKEAQLKNNILSNIIYKNKNDVEANKVTILDNILVDIIEESSVLSDMFSILYSFFKVYFSQMYNINEDFFNEQLIMHEDRIYIQEDCTMIKIDISANEINKYKIDLNEGSVINLNNDNEPYTLISFIKKDLSSRSGFILLNNFSKKSITNKLQVKVGE